MRVLEVSGPGSGALRAADEPCVGRDDGVAREAPAAAVALRGGSGE